MEGSVLAIFMFVCVTFVAAILDCNINKKGLPNDACSFDLRMKHAHPKVADEYLCSGYNVTEDIYGVSDKSQADGYIVRFEALADASTAHHILVYGCSKPLKNNGNWNCGKVCDGEEQILFAWAKNAPPLSLPKDVGRHIGASASVESIVVQVHYAKPLDEADDKTGIKIIMTQQRQQFIAGIYLLLAYDFRIPPNTPKKHADISCKFGWHDSIVPFGFRTHAHSLGRVISGYRVRNDKYEMIGKGNPQWPQAFYPVNHFMKIENGDILVARCTYDSTGRGRTTDVGATSSDEMCNFYIMYYTNATSEKNHGPEECFGNNQKYVFKSIPSDSDTPLPSNPDLEEEATGHHHHHAMNGGGQDSNQHTEAPPDVIPVKNLPEDITNKASQLGNRPFFLNQNYRSGNSNDMISQGKSKLSTSLGDGVLRDGYINGRRLNDLNPYNSQQNPQSYLFDYEPEYSENDYYDGMRQRNRNKVRKPYYDLYDAPKRYGFSDFSDSRNTLDKTFPTLSRNRNKMFDAKYDDYAANYMGNNSPPDDMLVTLKKGNNPAVLSSMDKGSNSVSPEEASSRGTGSDQAKSKSWTDSTPRSDLDLKYVSEVGNLQLGQVGGVAVNKDGELHIFHRGSRIWNSESFDAFDNYQLQELPVRSDAILILNKNGTLKRSFGKDRYYLPHGLSLDHKENIWVTDVALHQVFRIPKGGTQPDMTLGIMFEPGNDKDHFCKPADVAVLPTGEFFVADGYCNSRVMKFDQNGYLLKQWGTESGSRGADGFPAPSTFMLPHGLALAEDKGLVCVADRQNGRIQCFDFNGKFVRQMHPPQFGRTLYALEYCPRHGGILFAVNGPGFGREDPDTQGFTLDINTGNLLSTWNTPGQGLNHPHDVTVDTDRHLVYVGELNPSKVWKFEMTKALYSANKTKDTHAKSGTLPSAVNANKTGDVGTKLDKQVDTAVESTSMKSVVSDSSSKYTPPSRDVVTHTTSSRGVVTHTTPSRDVVTRTTPSRSVVTRTTPSRSVITRTSPSKGVVTPVTSHKAPVNNSVITSVNHSAKHNISVSNTAAVSNANTATVSGSNKAAVIVTNTTPVSVSVKTATTNSNKALVRNTPRPAARVSTKPSVSKYVADVDSSNVNHTVKEAVEVDVLEARIEKNKPVESEDFAPSLIIGMLLVIPVVLLVVITVLIRLYHTGYFSSCRRRPGGSKAKFNLGSLLNPHKGFDRLSTEDDDHENAMDDSDNEEFSIVRKA